MICTGTHYLSIQDEDFEKLPGLWSEYIQQDMKIWCEFHDWWLKAKIPKYIVRYEDLVGSPEKTLRGLLEFILNVPSIEGTLVEQHLKLTVGEKAPEVYKPR